MQPGCVSTHKRPRYQPRVVDARNQLARGRPLAFVKKHLRSDSRAVRPSVASPEAVRIRRKGAGAGSQGLGSNGQTVCVLVLHVEGRGLGGVACSSGLERNQLRPACMGHTAWIVSLVPRVCPFECFKLRGLGHMHLKHVASLLQAGCRLGGSGHLDGEKHVSRPTKSSSRQQQRAAAVEVLPSPSGQQGAESCIIFRKDLLQASQSAHACAKSQRTPSPTQKAATSL
jgi:hypothetical protein